MAEGIVQVVRAALDQPEGQQRHGPSADRRPGQGLDPLPDVAHDGRGQPVRPKLDVDQGLSFRHDRHGRTKVHPRGFGKLGQKLLDGPHHGVHVVLQRFPANAAPAQGGVGQEVYLRAGLSLRRAGADRRVGRPGFLGCRRLFRLQLAEFCEGGHVQHRSAVAAHVRAGLSGMERDFSPAFTMNGKHHYWIVPHESRRYDCGIICEGQQLI